MLSQILPLAALSTFVGAQTTEPADVTFGCIDSSSSDFSVEGNYTWYANWEDHSIWYQVTAGEAYVIYFDDSLGNEYQAFGLYKCDDISYYTEQVAEMEEKSPAVLMGCQGVPVLFCPALNADDALSLMDGMNANDGSLDWVEIYHFYDCPHWFDYEDDMNYPSVATLSFLKNAYCAAAELDTSGNNANNPGQKVNTGTDPESQRHIDGTTLAILWSLLGVFTVFCLVFIGVFLYKWKQRHVVETVHMNLHSTELDEDGVTHGITGKDEDDDREPSLADEMGTR